MDIEIRPLASDELPLLESSIPSQYHEARLEVQDTGQAIFLIAWSGAEACGHLVVFFHQASAPEVIERVGRMPYIEAIVVREELRSLGIGTRLIHAAEVRLEEGGAKTVGLAVGVTNLGAQRLYERLGYELRNDIKPFDVSWTYVDDDGVNRIESELCIYLQKALSPKAQL